MPHPGAMASGYRTLSQWEQHWPPQTGWSVVHDFPVCRSYLALEAPASWLSTPAQIMRSESAPPVSKCPS